MKDELPAAGHLALHRADDRLVALAHRRADDRRAPLQKRLLQARHDLGHDDRGHARPRAASEGRAHLVLKL